jgi:hypothetical protein
MPAYPLYEFIVATRHADVDGPELIILPIHKMKTIKKQSYEYPSRIHNGSIITMNSSINDSMVR